MPTLTVPDDVYVVIGYKTYPEMAALQNLLNGSTVVILEAAQDFQHLVNAVHDKQPHLVFINPDLPGFSADYIQQLLMGGDRPIPVIGFAANDTGGLSGPMRKAGAMGFLDLSTPTNGVDVVAKIRTALERAYEDRAGGKHTAAVELPPLSTGGAIRGRTITTFLPKGGSSSRSTTSVNIAAALAALGHNVVLLDFDNTKGDDHLMLGYAVDQASQLTAKAPLVQRGLFDLVMNVRASGWDGAREVEPRTIRNYLVLWEGHHAVGKHLHFLPGLLRPTLAGDSEWANNSGDVFSIARSIIRVVRTMYDFVVVDISQDYNMPLVAATLEEATDVVLPIPPVKTAIVDVALAMPPLLKHYGTYNKFFWFPALWNDEAGAPDFATISRELKIPQLSAMIPDDPATSAAAINAGVPYVLTDKGPLGTNMMHLVATFDPRAGEIARKNGRSSSGVLARVGESLFKRA